MVDPLTPLLADGVIEEVVARLKSGKEADLWLVRHGGEIVAAKVYKARQARSFKNNAAYKEGRQVRDTRTQRAMDRGSRFGQAAAEEAWKAKEADALHTLHAAGVRVPKPVMFYEGVLLMELVVDADGRPAPRLVDVHLPRERAAALYADLRGQMVQMLCCDLVHGDLSPYNVLLGSGGPVVIDLPQVVGAAHNSQAEAFFQRDLQNLRRFFAAHDPALDASAADGREIWRAYVRRELTPGFVPTGRSPEPPRSGHGHRPSAGGAPHWGGARPERSDQPAGSPPRLAPRPPAPSHAEGRRPGPSSPSHPGRGGTDRRHREAPMPEVLRVVRPPPGSPRAPAKPLGPPGAPARPLGPSGATARPLGPPGAPARVQHATPSAAAGQPGGQPSRRKRRRRRSSRHNTPPR